MTKTIEVYSKKNYLHDKPEYILFGTYAYCPASVAVKALSAGVLKLNEQVDENLAIKIIVKRTDDEYAKVKLKGARKSIDMFMTALIAKSDLLQKFDMKF